jgi:hypothetical protein
VIEAYKAKYPRHDGETIKRPNITNGLTEIVINKPNIPPVVSANIVAVKNHGVEIIEIDGMM